jgi:hypothetical protein
MTLKRYIRTVTGGLAVVTVLALVVADTVHPNVTLAIEDKVLLVSLASTLLGLDFVLESIPIQLIVSETPSSKDGDQEDSDPDDAR